MSSTPLQSTDLYRLRWVLDPALSPDGQRLVYVLKNVHPDDPGERYQYQLLQLDRLEMAENGVGRCLLPGFDAVVRRPRWSPSGTRLAFLSNKSGSTQLWVLDHTTGQLGRITDDALGVSDFEWSPDGKRIVFVADVADETGDHGELNPGHYRIIRRLGYKTDGSGYWNGAWPRIFVVPVNETLTQSESVEVTTERFGASNPRWSPDGTAIAYLSSGDTNPDETAVRNIYQLGVAVDGDVTRPGETRQLTRALAVQSLSWSPSGNEIAFLGDDLSDDRATNAGVWVCRVADGAVVNLTADIDRPAGDFVTDDMNAEASGAPPAWSADGGAVVAIMSDRGRSIVVSLDFPGDEAFRVGTDRSYADELIVDPWGGSRFNAQPIGYGDHRVFALAADGHGAFVAGRSDATSPGDLFLITRQADGNAAEQRLTAVNDALLAGRLLAHPEPVAFTGSEEQRIEGWILTPPAGADAPYPLVLHIHGGPHSAYSMAFNFELQHLAAAGYAVLFVNPHGSHTYGRRINTGTRQDWGSKDYDDLMLAVDHALGRPDIDGDRLGVAGGSYGGWMTNYIVTRTNRFKAAVAQRSSSNRISTMLSSTVGYKHRRWEAPGTPWEHHDYFIKISPVLHAGNVETPLLLEHAEDDHLCPLMQAEEMFTALKLQGKPVELIYFLDESHHMLRIGRPVNRVDRLEHVARWFNRYV